MSIRDIAARKEAEDRLHAANEQLTQLAMFDGLTDIANRRSFDLAMERELRRAIRIERPVAMLLIDVDHFKQFNDNYGHLQGDACLRGLATAIDTQMRRPGDFVARYGGEEFVVLLPETEQDGALHCAEKIMAAISKLAIPHHATQSGLVTVSIGLAVAWPTSIGSSARALIEAADTALYEAKRSGRGCIHLGGASPVVDILQGTMGVGSKRSLTCF